MGILQPQSVERGPLSATRVGHEGLRPEYDELWLASDSAAYGLTRAEFDAIVTRAAAPQAGPAHEPKTAESRTADQDRTADLGAADLCAADLGAMKLNDLVLARACAAGHEQAWQHFIATYHEPLVRAAVAITGSDTLGRDLAGSLYAELYGMKEREGERRSPLESYRGRGSLMGWLRTTLAQRHVDHHRRTHREETLDDPLNPIEPAVAEREDAETPRELALLRRAIEQALGECATEERFLLAAYYLDDRTLLEVARVLGVHEATVSRRLRRVAEDVRKGVMRNLQQAGLSRRSAEEALGADPRDIEMNLRKLLQISAAAAFPEKKAER